jgi:integrase/recombinase XerC
VDIKRYQVKVLGKGNKERIIPLHNALAEHIEVYLNERTQVFKISNFLQLLITHKGKPVTTRQVYDIVKKHLSTVTTAEKKSPHVLRHSFATHLTGNGAELNAVKELLGHSSLAATQVYTHNSIERLRDIHKKAHPKG